MSARRSHDRIRPQVSADRVGPWRPSVPLSRYLDVLLMPREESQSYPDPIAALQVDQSATMLTPDERSEITSIVQRTGA